MTGYKTTGCVPKGIPQDNELSRGLFKDSPAETRSYANRKIDKRFS